MELISIIVPVYSVEKYLERCVKSLVVQTYQNIEIILVDDGSPDNSGKLCDELAKTDNRIRVIHKENVGVSSARNVALGQAQGKYIGFMDSDDWVEPNMFSALVQALENNKAQLVSCDLFQESENIENSYTHQETAECEVIEVKEPYYDIIAITQIAGYLCNKLFIKELITQELDEDLAQNEDLLFVVQYLKNVNKMVHISQKLYHYQMGDFTPSVGLNARILTLPKAYEKILSEYQVSALEYAWLIEKNLLKIFLNLKGRYKFSRAKDKSILTMINCGIKRYRKTVLKSKKISAKEKMNIRLTSCFPKTMLSVKIKRLTAQHKKGIWTE